MKTELERLRNWWRQGWWVPLVGVALWGVAWPGKLLAGAGDLLAEEPRGVGSSQLTEAWQPRSIADLRGRAANTAVWTGREMIIFGGEGMGVSFGDGARYDPVRDSWERLPSQGSPSSRTGHTAVWTGKEMIVWGGFGGIWGNDTNRNDGAAYNPETGSWRPLSRRNAPAARFDHSAVWTGKEMLVWGGYTDSHARYGGGHAP